MRKMRKMLDFCTNLVYNNLHQKPSKVKNCEMTKNNSEDIRIKKTKNKLFQTFVKLLEEISIESITVNDLCAYAGIRRATFYKHFKDKLDFCAFCIKQLRDIFDNYVWMEAFPPITSDYYIAYAKRTVDFLDEHDKVVSRLLESSMLASLIQLITEQNYVATLERLTESQKSGMKLIASPKILAMMLAGGVSAAIVRWLKNKHVTKKEVFIRELSDIIKHILEP